MGRPFAHRRLAVTLALAASVLVPAIAAAHPLGNFTINHYAALTIAPDHVELEVIIDMAEIPAFQERQSMDLDADGEVADGEVAGYAAATCRDLAADLALERDGDTALTLVAGPTALTFPPGAGGLSTLRLTCTYQASLAPPISGRPTTLSFRDDSFEERIGWREILATGSGTILDTHGLPPTSPSEKLTLYPTDLVKTPLDIRSATIDARLDPDAVSSPSPAPVGSPGTGPGAGTTGGGTTAGGTTAELTPAGGVPGGVAAELPDIFRTVDLTPVVILASLLTAVAIGAGHALTPGHGKTLMAAYLVGSRGTAVHAVGLGLSVAVSHTLGILALALLIVGAGSVLPPDLVYRVTPVIAGVSIVAIGGWMLLGEIRRRRTRTVPGDGSAERHGAHAERNVSGHDQYGGDDHSHPHDHQHGGDDHQHPNDEGADHAHDHSHPHGAESAGEHSHGGVRHSHLPQSGTTLTWRGLFVLGLAGGLIPSTSALLILLGSIAAGRPAFGLVLVVAFGLGMAAVMTGVGLAMIVARTRLDRLPSRSHLGRLATAAPLVASVAVLSLGLVLTWQAVAGSPIL